MADPPMQTRYFQAVSSDVAARAGNYGKPPGNKGFEGAINPLLTLSSDPFIAKAQI